MICEIGVLMAENSMQKYVKLWPFSYVTYVWKSYGLLITVLDNVKVVAITRLSVSDCGLLTELVVQKRFRNIQELKRADAAAIDDIQKRLQECNDVNESHVPDEVLKI